MNNKIITIGIIVLVFGIVALSAMITPNKSESIKEETQEDIMERSVNESKSITTEEKKEFIDIDVDTYLQYYKGSSKKIVLMARHTCQYCQVAEPILQKIAKDYNLDIYYLNTEQVNTEDQERLLSSNELFQSGFGTPFIVVVQNEKIINHVDGLTDTKHYLQFLKDSKMI